MLGDGSRVWRFDGCLRHVDTIVYRLWQEPASQSAFYGIRANSTIKMCCFDLPRVKTVRAVGARVQATGFSRSFGRLKAGRYTDVECALADE